MALTTQLPGLYLLEVEEKGRGVFCLEDISKESLIELCPVIIIPPKETAIIHKTSLHDYYFIWDIDANSSAIALGYGSLYNHSENANADFYSDKADHQIKIIASRDIPAGEEITINYISIKETGFELWFEPG